MKKFITSSLIAAFAAFSLIGCDVVSMDEVSDSAGMAMSAASDLTDAAKALIPDSVKETIKEDTKEVVTQAQEAVKDAAKEVKEEAGQAVKDAAKEVAEEAGQAVKEAAKEAIATAGESFKEKAKQVAKDTAVNMAEDEIKEAMKDAASNSSSGLLHSTEDIGLTDVDGNGHNYRFTYGEDVFSAEYTTDNWKIHDSYRVENAADMRMISQALIDEHPIHGKDMVSYRTAEDMVYEWQIHNFAYDYLDESDPRRQKCKEVDFDPKDQNRTVEEFLEIYG
jgi:hypothetical protein